jgi:hypothetical protein
MDNPPELVLELTEAYEKKLKDLERTLIPGMKDHFQLYQALFRSVYELFIQKGLLKADPYKNERHLSDIYQPDEGPMTETELDEQLPIKLSEFDNLLDFLNNYTQFKASSLSLKKLKILAGIVKHVDWTKLTQTNNLPITHGVAVIAEKIRLGSDTMASASLQSNHNKLDQVCKDLLREIKLLAEFKREEYKLMLRQKVVAHHPVFQTNLNKEDFAKNVKSVFARTMEGEAYFPELVNELFDEMTGSDPAKIKQTILDRFKVAETKKKAEVQKQYNLREILLEGVHNLGTASRHLDESTFKLKENLEILDNRPKGLWERFKEWIIKMNQGKEKEVFFDVELIDPNTTMKKIEHLAFKEFCANVQKKSKYLTSFLVKTSAASVRMESTSEDAIYELLEKNIADLKAMHLRLDALDAYFKAESPQNERARMRGIKVELGNLKNSIAGVSQKLHEFVAKKDEIEQLKRLGIKVE